MSKLPISLILICKNEAHNLPRLLDSVQDLVSEIIAVVNDTTDNSVEILSSYQARVYPETWYGFGPQKNLALNYATNPWILSLDADEEVSPKMYREIQRFVNLSNNPYSGISFCRKSYFMGRWIKHGEWYPDRVLRLFKKSAANFSEDYVHEKLLLTGKIYYSKTNLLHYSFPSLYTFLTKTESFTRNFMQTKGKNKCFSQFNTLIRAMFKFFKAYILKRGFLDGYPGLIIAIQAFYSTIFRYSMILEENQKHQTINYAQEDL